MNRKLQGKNQMMTMVKKQDGKSDDNGEEANENKSTKASV